MTDDVKLTDVIKENDELKTLQALQMKVAQTLDSTTSARDIGQLAKQLREIAGRIAELGGGEYADDIAAVLGERSAAGKPGNVR